MLPKAEKIFGPVADYVFLPSVGRIALREAGPIRIYRISTRYNRTSSRSRAR
jgi:hypothetical protein